MFNLDRMKYLGQWGVYVRDFVAVLDTEAVRIRAEDYLLAREHSARYLLRNERIGYRDQRRIIIIDAEVAGLI